ncbi:SAM-dependent methyltransferase [Pseudonocardia endophytica]|uniref:S-adenosyl-L-methionine-dependent methyltransferase n=1 Tax=Pseudonocardia endophytica TaxID=401976 RepID=A0A4R1HMZ4_PSEEN|nr:SAM-dependent methyltransferase [Pseudonocardia endophytica]TCK22541.1 8-demethyl-8-(2,3,4-trimethoxy-alpha-L-rhamnosyl)tetracenomycin-C O-methyltransferase [Pseudonocardia endophytica]
MTTTGHTPAGGNSVPGQWDITESVGLTALAVAAARAAESERREALVRDRFANDFVRASGHPMPTGTDGSGAAWTALVDMMAVRSRVLDDLLLRAVTDGIRQVVVLAAGLDARAFRVAWPAGTTLYEVDQPPVIEFKQRVLDVSGARPACRRRTVPVDLRDDWGSALREAGFDPSTPTAWLVEGLLPYLPAQAEADLFVDVDALSAPGSRMAIEAIALDHADEFVGRPEVRELGAAMGTELRELWNTEPRVDVVDRLTAAGWTVRPRQVAELGAELGRPFDDDLGAMAGLSRIVDASRSA